MNEIWQLEEDSDEQKKQLAAFLRNVLTRGTRLFSIEPDFP